MIATKPIIVNLCLRGVATPCLEPIALSTRFATAEAKLRLKLRAFPVCARRLCPARHQSTTICLSCFPWWGYLHHFSACNQGVNWYNVGYMQPIKKELADIIYSDKEVLSGTPCFKETRVPVPLILDYLALGWSLSDLKEFYPTVKTEYITKLIQVLSGEFIGHVKTA
jgi:uncharacterized protein (DUF433 family)